MATLNLSTNGPSITRSYQSVVNSPPPSGPAANSQTYGQWAIFSVSAPLVNAFTQDAGGKESVLKVQSTGEGELVDLIEEFSDGRIQFAFVKVKDTNTALPKFVLIGWCGEGVPERTKGYFTSHLAAVSRILHGYHVQITARSDRDLTPDGIVQKVADASGSKYSSNTKNASSAGSGPPLPPVSKPAFTPTRVGGGRGGFNPLAGGRPQQPKDTSVDEDGWGVDAPPVTRTQLEKVQSAYKPTKVNMKELSAQKPEPSRIGISAGSSSSRTDEPDVVKGAYQPVGKVDIAEIRRRAQQSGSSVDDRPTSVKGAYEPVGKVDIAAIRAKAKPRSNEEEASNISPAATGRSSRSGDSGEDYSSSFTQPERLTSLPKPKVANRFGATTGSFTGTKAPVPAAFGFDSKPTQVVPVGAASRTFADEGGKTPAQIWAERKARERGLSGAAVNPPAPNVGGITSPVEAQKSGGEWKSGYNGKSWAPINTNTTGRSTGSIGQQLTGEKEQLHEELPASPAGGIGALRDRFKGAVPMGAPSMSVRDRSIPSPPPPEIINRPNVGGPHGGVAIPGLPMRPSQASYEHAHDEEDKEEDMSAIRHPPSQHRSSSPPSPPRTASPIRVAMPVARGKEVEVEPPAERFEHHPLPTQSISKVMPDESDIPDVPAGYDSARQAGEIAAESSLGQQPAGQPRGKRALVQFDYEKAEDNELELREGEYVTNIEMVDEDWWMGQNLRGETGLFPANYVELVENGEHRPEQHKEEHVYEPAPAPVAATSTPAPNAGKAVQSGPTAIAIYDYEAAEENELSFAEGTKITGIEFPDEDWWFGEAGGKSGLFPANYVELQK